MSGIEQPHNPDDFALVGGCAPVPEPRPTTADRMLTDDQLEAIRERANKDVEHPLFCRDDLPRLLRHIEALQQERRIHDKCVDDMSAMLDEESDRAEAAQERVEGLETLLRRLLKAIGHGDETTTRLSFNGKWLYELAEAARDARAALEDSDGA